MHLGSRSMHQVRHFITAQGEDLKALTASSSKLPTNITVSAVEKNAIINFNHSPTRQKTMMHYRCRKGSILSGHLEIGILHRCHYPSYWWSEPHGGGTRVQSLDLNYLLTTSTAKTAVVGVLDKAALCCRSSTDPSFFTAIVGQ